MRYGQSTLHRARGVPTAINVGDHLLGLGYRIVSGLVGVDAGTSRDVVRLLADAHVRLARGQGAELWWRDDGDRRLAPAEALAIYGLKTSPAFEAAIAIGIRLAGLEPGVAAAVDRYALHVGTGFQVLNDLKDWQGDLENARRAAGDLLGGRPTVMWALAMERLSGDEAARLRKLAGMAAAADAPEAAVAAAVAEARELYRRADVFVRTAAIVRDERAGAAAAIAGCRLPRLREVLEFLLDLAVPESAADVGAG
jgi:geranylgeranyl pyrophosphate synthase